MSLEEEIKKAEVAARLATELADAAKRDLYDLKCKLSERNCPHKIGDVIEIVNHWNHCGKKLRIEQFLPADGYVRSKEVLRATWKVGGKVLRKDGSDSVYESGEHGI